ncbi:MAG: hypothetical protein M3Z02_12395 [Actinomycetota bacterium]|nr:hypothetical protein [Actinomycetota bacterium]
MSESAIPFAPDHALVGDQADDATAGRSRRPLLFAAGALLLLLAAAAYFFVLKGADAPASKPAAAVVLRKPASPAIAPRVSASPVPSPAGNAAVPPPVTQPLGRDPFKALYVAPAAAVAPAVGAAPAAGAAAPAAAAPAAAAPAAPTKSGTSQVALVGVDSVNGKQVATTKVGDASFSPAVGDVFAKTFKLVSVTGSCATYLHGDVRFALCPGQTFQP